MQILLLGQIVLLLIWWQFVTPDIIPKPSEILSSLKDLWEDGFGVQIFISLTFYAQALFIATIFSLLLTYSTAMAFFRPIGSAWARLRFLGMVGLPFIASRFIHGVHEIKLALMVFAISVFMVTGMLDVVASIPKEKYDLARTLRFNEWQVLWEVEILGRIDVMFDVIRQNAAIGWMMIAMIEGLFKSEGGVGAMLEIQNHQFQLVAIFAIAATVLVVGTLQDYLLGVIKNGCCPYASLLLERR